MNNNNTIFHSMKVCKKCNEEFPSTSVYFGIAKGNKDGLHGTCKKCRAVQVKNTYKKRKEKGKHLIHENTCEWCGNKYKTNKPKKRFCDRKCQYAWQRSDEYKEIVAKNHEKYNKKTLSKREHEFSRVFNEKFKGQFIYLSDYTHSEEEFKLKCLTCGNVFTRNARITRAGGDERITCKNCKEQRTEIRNMIHQNKQSLDSMVVKLVEEIEGQHKKKINICLECDEVFISRNKKMYCDRKCSQRSASRRKELRRRNNKMANGEIDDISLDRLIERDKNTCHICKTSCNKDDHIITDEGYFITGESYPSIDHVIPISKGGTHTWNNVKLAHFYCNTIKSDTLNTSEQLSIL